jgi:WD40 repeat protein
MFSNGITNSATTLIAGAGLVLLGACNQAGVQNAAPRLASSIPEQTASGGVAFTLDLDDFVADRETANSALTYTVVAGGGSFTGTAYVNTFATLGSYTVTVRVTDPEGKSVETSFDVDVKTANLGVITSGNDLDLLDTDTLHVRTLATANGNTLVLKDTLVRGFVVFERLVGTDYDLYVYDANTTATVALGDDRTVAERHAGKVGADRVLFTAGNATSKSLRLYDVTTGTTTVVAAADNEFAGDPLVSGNLVYHELTSNGQNDIYVFDASTGQSTAVSTDARAEETVAVLADGALVFSRRGDAGENDLFYYKRTVGVLEVGADVAAIASLSKTFGGSNSTGLVAFAANNAGQLDFYVWNPLAGITAVVATTTDNESFAATLPNGNFLYYVLLSGTDLNVRLFDVTSGLSRAFPASTVNDLVVGALSDSRVIVSKAEATGTHLYLATYAGGTVTDAPIATTAGQSFALDAVLANNKIVFRNTTSGGVSLFAPATSTTTALGATSVFVAAMPTAGDFVVKDNAAGQFDLLLWDDSAGATVSVASSTTHEEQARGLADGRILFTREAAGSTQRNLFVWKPSDTSVTPVTTDADDHTVQATFAADNR